MSESFYPLFAVLEVVLRNSIDYQLTRRFDNKKWYDNKEFVKIATRFQIDRLSRARTNIYTEKKIEVTLPAKAGQALRSLTSEQVVFVLCFQLSTFYFQLSTFTSEPPAACHWITTARPQDRTTLYLFAFF